MTKTQPASKLPSALGYRMAAEWEPHESTWLAWPHFRGDWPGKLEPISWVYAEIIRNLARHERVDLVVSNMSTERKATAVLEKADALSENIRFHRWRTDRVWTRDSGCIFLAPPANGNHASRLALHFEFNAWAKYDNYKLDAKLGAHIAEAADAAVIRPRSGEWRVVLEGGSIDVNGAGTLLTTEECLLSATQQRSPHMDRAAYDQLFADYFGARFQRREQIVRKTGMIGERAGNAHARQLATEEAALGRNQRRAHLVA